MWAVAQTEMKAYLVREMVTVHDEVCAQSVGTVLHGCGLLLSAQEEGHGLLQQCRGAQLTEQGCQQGSGGQDALLRPVEMGQGQGQGQSRGASVGVQNLPFSSHCWLTSPSFTRSFS